MKPMIDCIKEYHKMVNLGITEDTFLYLFSLRPYSTYDIMKKLPQKMAYKNVHTRVRRLKELGLIDFYANKYDGRAAILYQITESGLDRLKTIRRCIRSG